MYNDTKRPAATPREPFESLSRRQRRIYAYIKARGPQLPGSISSCVDLYELFESTAEARADMEAMIDAGWLRTVGISRGAGEWGYDIPEADREGYTRPFVREVLERVQTPEWWDEENGRPYPWDTGPYG